MAVYQVNSTNVNSLLHALQAESSQSSESLHKRKEDSEAWIAQLKNILRDISAVPPHAVVFNWECCAGFGAAGFPEQSGTVELIHRAVDRGSMVMASDFSLKALITDWRVSDWLLTSFDSDSQFCRWICWDQTHS